MTPLKNQKYKLILILALFAALVIAVIIYYNRRIKAINDRINQTSMVQPVCSPLTPMTNDY